ncbi:hypothetical protein ON010_g18696 [Phytophthora cinnamomi]|nr:hypothetical protein ON010_g18696 [Phytophthora cinnamomi]
MVLVQPDNRSWFHHNASTNRDRPITAAASVAGVAFKHAAKFNQEARATTATTRATVTLRSKSSEPTNTAGCNATLVACRAVGSVAMGGNFARTPIRNAAWWVGNDVYIV